MAAGWHTLPQVILAPLAMHAVASVRQQLDAMVRLPHAVITALQAVATLVVHLVLGGFTPSAQVTYANQVVQIAATLHALTVALLV